MAEEWLPARLIPTSGIRGAAEQETRATSALLSVLGAVQEFGRTVLRGRFGAPAGPIEAYIEVPLELPGGEVVRPDGLIRVRRGSRTWTALFEVKTGRNELDRAQVENYLDAARHHNFDAVVTISNQIVPATGDHPVDVDRRKLRRVALHHISWVALLTEAVLVKDHRGVEDPDQAWILGQLIAYLEHPQSGAMEFADMGSHWTSVRDSARAGTLTANSDGVDDVVDRWDEFSRYLCLHLGRELGADVEQVLPRRDRRDTAGRKARLIRELADTGTLRCTLRVPSVVADIDIVADLTTRMVSASLYVSAPGEGRPRTRINWLVRQLRSETLGNVRIDTSFESRSATSSVLLEALVANPDNALLEDRRAMPRGFRVTLTRPMGMQRNVGARSFVGSVTALLEEFYGSVAQELKEWTPRAPRLPEQQHSAEPEAPAGGEATT